MQKQPHLELSLDVPQNRNPQNHPELASDLILHYLEQIGVEYVFGIPGGGIEPLYNALARSQRRGGPRPVIARHESGAAFMADGYARESGKLGVCCATTGPGATNMLTGVASAYMDHTPLLAITAQTSLRTFGRGATQESSCTGVNTLAMFQPCTRYNSLVSHVEQLERKLIAAITVALQPPFGPTHLSIPIDVMRTPVDIDHNINLTTLLSLSNAVDGKAIGFLYQTLYSAQNIVFVLGAGVGEATGLILELAKLINAQVIATPHGKGLVDPYHPQYRGVYGLAGHVTAHSILKDKSVDAVLAIGTDLDELATNGWYPSALLSKRMIFIDSSPHYFSRSPMARFHFSGSIMETFAKLLARFGSITKKEAEHQLNQPTEKPASPETPVIRFERRVTERRIKTSSTKFTGISYLHTKERRQDEERRTSPYPAHLTRHFALKDEDKYLSDVTPIKPQRLMYDLSRLFPSNTRFLADIGNSFLWAIHYLNPVTWEIVDSRPSNTGSVRLGMGFSPMTWAIGTSIGTALAAPGNPTVCITGDGALLMGGQELTTAIHEKLPVIFVILNDAALGTVKHGQQLAGAELIGFDLPKVDFVAYAKSLGADAYAIHSPQDMAKLDIATMCRRHGPTVLDVHIDPDEVPPLEERISMLKTDMSS
ncbi:MAG: thiamine pyrophosphate-binding protein [Gammaproteobacteria bacterium]